MSAGPRCIIPDCPARVEHDGDLCDEHTAALARGIAAARRSAQRPTLGRRPADRNRRKGPMPVKERA